MWVLGPFVTDLCRSWARPLSAHRHGSVKPISRRFVSLDFCPLQLPPSPHGSVILWVEGPMGWWFNTTGMTVQRPVGRRMPWTALSPDKLFGSHLWRMTRVALWLDFILDWRIASSSVHLPYKYHILPFSFLHFLLKHTVKAHPSSLSKTTPFRSCIRHHHTSSVHSPNW